MRRSTAAAVGTLTGAALIVGVRLTVATPDVSAAPPVDLADATPAPAKPGSKSAPPKKAPAKKAPAKEAQAKDTGLTDGVFKGRTVTNPYGRITVTIKVTDGQISAADATYPTTGDSARINPPAVAKLKQATLQAQDADVDAVSGATFTSDSYKQSLQAALDAADG